MRQLMRICEQGSRILDPFAGSGTTLVAADVKGYNWTGIEMTGHYFGTAPIAQPVSHYAPPPR